MGFNISDKTLSSRINRYLDKAKKEEVDSLTKLVTGSVFTPQDPRPSDRSLADMMEYRIRSLNSSKRNANDALSLLQTAESSMAEINNMVTRMKEINIAAASTSVSDQERRFLLVEYEALFDEINRVTVTTEFNGIPLLNSASDKAYETLVFRVGDPLYVPDSNADLEGDVNAIVLEDFDEIDTSTESLGLRSARDLIEDADDEEGIELEDVEDLLLPDDEDIFATVYDEVFAKLAGQRAKFGGVQTRLHRALDVMDVYQENIAAAQSKISDVDYADEITKLLQARIQSNAATALLAQSRVENSQAVRLLNQVI